MTTDTVQTVDFCTIDNRQVKPYTAQLGFTHALPARLTIEILDCLGQDDLLVINLEQPLVSVKVYQAPPEVKSRALGMAMLNRIKSLDVDAYRFLIDLDKLTPGQIKHFTMDMHRMNTTSPHDPSNLRDLADNSRVLLEYITKSFNSGGAKWTTYGHAVSAYFRYKLPQDDF